MPAKSFHPVTPAILAIGLALSGLAAQADAQGLPPGCQPSNPNAPIEGALIGGAAGALLGSAIAGHHHKGDGAVVGPQRLRPQQARRRRGRRRRRRGSGRRYGRLQFQPAIVS